MENKRLVRVDGKIVTFDQACQYLGIGPGALYYRLANFSKCYVSGHLVERVSDDEINTLVEKVQQANININNNNNNNEKVENMQNIRKEYKRNKQLVCEQTGETVGTIKEFAEAHNKTETSIRSGLWAKHRYTDRDTRNSYVYEDDFDGVIKGLDNKTKRKWNLVNALTGEVMGNLNVTAHAYGQDLDGVNHHYSLNMFNKLKKDKKWVAPDGRTFVDETIYNDKEKLSQVLGLDAKATIILPADYSSRTIYCVETKSFFKNMGVLCDDINKKWYIVSRALRVKGQYVDPDTNRTYVVYCKWIKNQNKPVNASEKVETPVTFNVTPKKEVLENKTSKIITTEDKDIVKKMLVDLFDKDELDTINKVIESYKRINKN